MPISGPVVHRQLTDGYTQLQQRLEQARAEIGDTKIRRDELDDNRGEALVDLAEHYLPELTRDAIRDTWIEIRSTVAQILVRKEQHYARLREKLDRLNLNREHESDKLNEITARLDQALERQDELVDEVEKALRNDSDFVTLSDRAALAEVALERAEANLNEIEQDAARKLPAYDQSKLFRYLYDQKFGTSEYPKRGFTRRMDRMLAKYIGYTEAKKGYEFLKTTPTKMRQVIADDRQAFSAVMGELESRRDVVAADIGLTEHIGSVDGLKQERTKQLTVLDEIVGETEKVEHELTELEDTRGPYYREAVLVFRQMLERNDSRDLARRARSTPEISDDQIVARLAGVEAEIRQLDGAARERRNLLRDHQDMLDAMGRLIQRFRSAGFDSSRSQFEGTLDLADLLYRCRDARDIDRVWGRIQDAQRWGPTVMERVTEVAQHPLTQVLLNAAAHAAGAALEQKMRRAGRRRYRSSSWSGDSSWGGSSSRR